MVTKSQSAPGQFAAAVRQADPRSRVAAGLAPAPSGIEHGHENDQGESPALAPSVLEQLRPGPPRNADGTERQD